jgi:proprotein convertase subtilisin/kexin type 5
MNGYYDEGISNPACVPCDNSCATCSESLDSCLTCFYSDFRILIGNVCDCDDGYYDEGNATCSICDENCLTCVDNSTNCLTC